MAIAFGTKAETLSRIAPLVTSAQVLPQCRVTQADWTGARDHALAVVSEQAWSRQPVIVRSSALAEDRADQSLAGRFLSVGNVRSRAALSEAIDRVFASYDALAEGDEVFVQPYLETVATAGVVFSCDPATGAPYIVVNYDRSGRTDTVTSGEDREIKTFYYWKHGDAVAPDFLPQVIALVRELETLFDSDALDIEFAVTAEGKLYLLQVRPLRSATATVGVERHRELLARIGERIDRACRPHPYLHGQQTVFGVMPDWNPAEIIGTRPRPLALSLYRELVTDQIWAYQRSSYGYKNLRSFPLITSFHGMPYIDVRVSFNSFVPADVDHELSSRLVDHYIDRLLASPALHDKIEFEIVFSSYTLDLPERLALLCKNGFSIGDVTALADSLRRLTNRVAHPEHGLWQQDLARVDQLDRRRQGILSSDMDSVARIYWLIEDCKRWGTLPFAGLARAGFIAMQMLRSLVAVGVLNEQECAAFLGNLDTVTSRMTRDLHLYDRATFLAHYGHLRPGTYDILSPRYDEDPDRYLAPTDRDHHDEPPIEPFTLSLTQERRLNELLAKHGLEMDATGLLAFIRSAIQGRESAKFLFTRSLSEALSQMKELGRTHGLDAEAMSYTDIGVIKELYASSGDPGEWLRRSAEIGAARYAEARTILLPPVISDPSEVWAFHMPPNEPNFITQSTAEGPVRSHDAPLHALKGAIVLIANADPGFDWIFSKGISGLVTAYGGVNSHMAIRAHECGLPAVIGAGEVLFKTWQQAKTLRLDCVNRRVEVVRL